MEETDSDADLIKEAIAGNQVAAHALLYRYRIRLLEYVKRQLPAALKSLISPEDVLQDTWIEAFRRIKEFSASSCDAFARWLLTIARHRMIDLLRAVKSAKRGGGRLTDPNAKGDESGVLSLLESLAVYHRTPSQSAAAHELAVAMDRAIDRLPPDYGRAIRLRHLDQLAVKEAAARMNRTEGAFHQLCNRGLKLLRIEMRSESVFV